MLSTSRDIGISSFGSRHLRFTTSGLIVTYRGTSIGLVDVENIDIAFHSNKFRFYVAYKLKYMCLSNISVLESDILNSYFPSGHKIFPMGELNTVFKDLSNDVSQAILFAVLDKNPRGW